jgi:hypothetical protein
MEDDEHGLKGNREEFNIKEPIRKLQIGVVL